MLSPRKWSLAVALVLVPVAVYLKLPRHPGGDWEYYRFLEEWVIGGLIWGFLTWICISFVNWCIRIARRIVDFFSTSATSESSHLGGAEDSSLVSLAQQGNAAAMFELALTLDENSSSAADLEEALSWYEKAAASGLPDAQNSLGVKFLNGEGVVANETTARYWFRKAAAGGSLDAMHNLGVLYEEGLGVSADIDTAIHWYRAAADRGDANSLFALGCVYEFGAQHLQPDLSRAYHWYNRAAEQGHEEAKACVTRLLAEADEQEKPNTRNTSSFRTLSCPQCDQKLRIPFPPPAESGKCKACGGSFRVRADQYGNLVVSPSRATETATSAPLTIDTAREILGVGIAATQSEVREAYRRKMQEYHPDRVERLGEKLRALAEQEAKRINAAYKLLRQHGAEV